MDEQTYRQKCAELSEALARIAELSAENERLKQTIKKLNAEKYIKSDTMSSRLRDALRE
jgi:cell division protein FtsB